MALSTNEAGLNTAMLWRALGFVGLLRTWLHRVALNPPKEWRFWRIR